ncbi:hypothetical protein MWU60_00865 [Yoonia sp. F2084L]|uniref:hypothetical protein n=1 Tax=Yoonia sp. F2084L TaxID=2926419 RepID=UPI001FF49F17|nr:hypothetical protein [Yoonia sp. F2084L]MCK0094105.1 hypothetical protein [Yoonia sp. F2084L]
MKRPKTQMPKRPRMASSASARTPKDAAINLVRLEFDAARLQMGIDQANNRAESYQQELSRNTDQRKILMGILNV